MLTTVNSTLTQDTLSTGLRVTHSVCSLTIAISGVIGNSFTIYKLTRKRTKQLTCNLYLLNLCINNLLSSSILLPLLAVNSFFNGWIYGNTFCKVFAYLMYANVCAEINALILLTLNRYFKVVHPVTYMTIYDNRLNNSVMIIFSWTFYSLLLILPLAEIWGQFGYNLDKKYCAVIRNDNYVLFMCGILLVTSVPIIFWSYASIFYTYKKSKQKIANFKEEADAKSKEQTPSAAFSSQEVRLLRMIVLILGCFMLTYMPYMVMTVADPAMTVAGRWVHTIATYLSWLHVALNPCIYTLRNPRQS